MLLFQIMHGLFTEHVAHGVLSGLMWSAAAFELSTYAVLSALELRLSRASFDLSSIPLVDYSAIALCISLGRGLTWVGYGTLSYPTVVIFKSSKILVVMISGILILNKRFRPAQYLAGVLVVLGLCTISAADRGARCAGASAGASGDSLGGIAVTCAAVAFEATVSNMQERALRRERRPLAEMILVTNTLGAGLLFAVAAGRGELRLLASRAEREPAALAWLFSTVSLAYGCGARPASPPRSLSLRLRRGGDAGCHAAVSRRWTGARGRHFCAYFFFTASSSSQLLLLLHSFFFFFFTASSSASSSSQPLLLHFFLLFLFFLFLFHFFTASPG